MNQAATLAQRTRELVRRKELPLTRGLERALDELAEQQSPAESEDELLSEALQALTGFGVLQPFLDDSLIEEIWINEPNQIL